jgi:hypothetical protein
VNDDDYNFQAIVFKARDSLPFLYKHYSELGDSTNWYHIYSKFRQFGKAESMWLVVTDFDGKEFTGVLDNHPTSVTNVKYGDTLKRLISTILRIGSSTATTLFCTAILLSAIIMTRRKNRERTKKEDMKIS